MSAKAYVIVEIAPAMEVTVLKSSVQTLLPKGTLKSIEPKGGKSHQKFKAIKPTSAADNSKSRRIKRDCHAYKDAEKLKRNNTK
jgi:preprotein translocase subunit YajC